MGDTKKYEGYHSRFQTTCDEKIDDFYTNPEAEHRENKCDDVTSFDGKFKHAKGFMKLKLHLDTLKDGDSYKVAVRDDAVSRFKWNNLHMHLEFKGNQVIKEVDFGSHSLMGGRLWSNPYVRWQMENDFTKNALHLGCVNRYNDLMVRSAIRLNGLMENDKKLNSIAVDTNGHFQRKDFIFRWFNTFNVTKRVIENFKMLTGYENSNYGALAHYTKVPGKYHQCGSYLIYRHNNNLSFGSKYTYTEGDHKDAEKRPHMVVAGMQYVADKNSTVRFTVDSEMKSVGHLSHKLNDSCTMLLNLSTNYRQFLPNATPYEKGYMGYPFNYGMVFKVNA